MGAVADLLIVGGGPAGLTLAILARNMGLTAGLVEAVDFPRMAHGDTLPAGIDTYFDLLGISKERLYRDAVPFQSHHLRWNDLEEVVTKVGDQKASIPTQGLHVPRHHLEPMLLERALEVGASILQPSVVKKVIVHNHKISGVSTSKGDFLAKFVIDAAGSRHWLARKLGMKVQFYSPSLYGYYNWARGYCPECHDHPLVYSDSQGWTWISRVGADMYQVTRQTFEPVSDFRSWLPPEFKAARLEPVAPTRGADLTWRIVGRPAGRGFFMIGDAVRRSDPVTQRGIERGMIDACKVSMLLARWKDGELQEDPMAQEYVDEIKGDYVKGLASSYGFLRTHPNAPDWLCHDEMYFRQAFL